MDVNLAVDANFTHCRTKAASKYDFGNITPSSFLAPEFLERGKKEYEAAGGEKIRIGRDETVSSIF